MKKNLKLFIFIVVAIIVTICGIIIYKNCIENKEKNIAEKNIEYNNELVDLSGLKDYMGDPINNNKAIELLNKIKNEYKIYLSNATENGDSTGLYIYFSNDLEANSDQIKSNAIISMIDDYISTREYDKDKGYFYISNGIDEQNRQFVYVSKNTKIIDYGIITNIENNIITIKNENIDYEYQVKIDESTKITNYRTTEIMNISDIKIGDYYNSGKVIRNIKDDEWKKECIKNLAYCYKEGNLICNPQQITNIQNMGDYVIITLLMEDSTTKYFNGKNNIDTFELKAIAYSNLSIPTHSGGVTVYNLKEEVSGFMLWIGLDKETINNNYPVISDIEIYDK